MRTALAGGFVAIALALTALLSQSPLTLAGTNSVPASAEAELEHGDVAGCQPAASLPAGTEAIRVAIEARAVGPAIALRVLAGSRLLAAGNTPAGWGSAPTVTVPVQRLSRAVTGARICLTIGQTVEPVRIHGIKAQAPLVVTGQLHGIVLRMEYLRRGAGSWWSRASSIAYHMGLGRAASGTWTVFLAIALMLAIAVLISRLTLRELR